MKKLGYILLLIFGGLLFLIGFSMYFSDLVPQAMSLFVFWENDFGTEVYSLLTAIYLIGIIISIFSLFKIVGYNKKESQ